MLCSRRRHLCATKLLSSRVPLSHDTHTHTTAMAAVGFCGEWFIFTCDTKLVAVHTKQTRFDPRLTFQSSVVSYLRMGQC